MSGADVAQRWLEAINAHDEAALGSLYSPNAVVSDPQFAEPIEGGDAIQRDWRDFFRAFPDLSLTLRSLVENDRGYAVEGRFSGTHRGPLTTPAGEIPPTGKRMQIDAAGFYQMDGQTRILEEHRYYDLAGLLAQLDTST